MVMRRYCGSFLHQGLPKLPRIGIPDFMPDWMGGGKTIIDFNKISCEFRVVDSKSISIELS